MQRQTMRPQKIHRRIVALQIRTVQFLRVRPPLRYLRRNFVRRFFRVRQLPENFSLPFSIPMIGDREYLIFPAADSDLPAVDPNNRATYLNLFRELFMTLYDTQIALSCKNLQVILLGEFILSPSRRAFRYGSEHRSLHFLSCLIPRYYK